VLPDLRLGPIPAESSVAVTQDFNPLARSLGVGLDAIVGFGVLIQSSFGIDYPIIRQRSLCWAPFETERLEPACTKDRSPSLCRMKHRLTTTLLLDLCLPTDLARTLIREWGERK
jgi:hypothetical protein